MARGEPGLVQPEQDAVKGGVVRREDVVGEDDGKLKWDGEASDRCGQVHER